MKTIKTERRILFLFAHMHKGGMQRAVSNISLALPEKFEQYVGFFGTENPPFEYNAKLENFNVPGSLEFRLVPKIKNVFLRCYKLRTFVRNNNIDIVVSFGETANMINVLSFNIAYRILCIRGEIGSYGYTSFYGHIYLNLIRWLYRFSDLIVAVSDDLKKQAEAILGKSTNVLQIPNLYHVDMIQLQAKSPLPITFDFFTVSPYILNVGSLVASKGQNYLISAFAKIANYFPDYHLLLIGRGPEKDNYVALANQLGVGSRVVFIDFDENPYRYMRLAKVFVLPSLSEGFPNVLVEAMACGCPVVAFDCKTGPREILGDSVYGELVGKMTAEDLAIKLYTLLSLESRLCHLKAQAMLRAECYSAQRIVGKWIEVLSEPN